MSYRVTPNLYGWTFGPATITRIFSSEKRKLGVWIEVAGSKERVEIRVTHGGRLRVGPVTKRKEPAQ